ARLDTTRPWRRCGAAFTTSAPDSGSWRISGAPHAAVARPGVSAGSRSDAARYCWPGTGLCNQCLRLRGTRISRGWRRPRRLGNKTLRDASVADNYRLQRRAPPIGAVRLSGLRAHRSTIAKLVEEESEW